MYATPTIRQALRIAAKAHRNQTRKGSDIPYLVHPVAVALILMEHTSDEATLAAALLHDVLEDARDVYSEEQMREDFGSVVTDTVKAVTKDDSITDWRARNEDYLATLRASNNDRAMMVCAADKINNLTDTLEDYEARRPNTWAKFHTGKEDQLWWYTAVYELVAEKMPGYGLTEELNELVERLGVVVEG